MKISPFLVTLVAAKVPKLKNLEAPEPDFFALDLGEEGERHQGIDQTNPLYSHYIKPTDAEYRHHGSCFNGNPHVQGIEDGEYSENSEWICGLVNHKRDKDKPREFVCFSRCKEWTNKRKIENHNFHGCRLHAPVSNPINGLAICDNGRWRVQNKLKKCFCDLCDPADAQRQLNNVQKRDKNKNKDGKKRQENHGYFDHYENCTGNSYKSWTHQQIISGHCGKHCYYQPKGYQQSNKYVAIPSSWDPPTAVCDRKKKKWNFKDKCNCMNLCSSDAEGLHPVPKDVPGAYWKFILPVDHSGVPFKPQGTSAFYHTAELHCGDSDEIMKRCGPAGLSLREKRHMFCANDKWISGADNAPVCACAKGENGTKSKHKHNNKEPNKKGKPNKKQKQKDHPNQDGQSAGAYQPSGVKGSGDKKPNKHKKNKH